MRYESLKKIAWWKLAVSLTLCDFAAAAVITPLSVGEIWLYAVATWVILPLIGVVSVYIAVRRGLNNYIGWFIPCACYVSAHWMIIGYPPSSAGTALLNAGLCLIAAATAQVKNERDDKKRGD